jgi:large subunit ribosomal protein L9
MQVILLQDLEGVGARGTTVNVKPGFARNYLLPRRMAIPTGTGASKLYEELQRQNVVAEERRMTEAKAEAAKLNGVQINIPAQANEEDTLFGSITSSDVADALAKAGHPVDRRQLVLDDHIKQLGMVDVPVKFFGGITATVKVWVVRA